jgi:hypothetical protein
MLLTLLMALIEKGHVSASMKSAKMFLELIIAKVKTSLPADSEVQPIIDLATAELLKIGVALEEDAIRSALTEFVELVQGGTFGTPDKGGGSIV